MEPMSVCWQLYSEVTLQPEIARAVSQVHDHHHKGSAVLECFCHCNLHFSCLHACFATGVGAQEKQPHLFPVYSLSMLSYERICLKNSTSNCRNRMQSCKKKYILNKKQHQSMTAVVINLFKGLESVTLNLSVLCLATLQSLVC